jgi:circadian clock protein KaiB
MPPLRAASEPAVKRAVKYRFRLFVADHAENSVRAVANLAEICSTHLQDRHEIEIVDVFKEPERALADGILMTPTLIRLAPLPLRRIIGTLSDARSVLQTLGLDAEAA